ncbi:hypothetical protein HGRIS_012455 [Hohenbuehelia grisea]|uniref:Ubiquitin-related modifier 1 n=1 Tax=Hohenbuehelia grisea TaxID=104357 RepID=A0ABR3IS97_9AGAR
MSSQTLSLKIVFQGGLDTLFAGQRELQISIPSHVLRDNSTIAPAADADPSTTKPADVTYLIHHLRDHHLKERVELFMQDGTVYVAKNLM